jgi:hypothetical protein
MGSVGSCAKDGEDMETQLKLRYTLKQLCGMMRELLTI